MGFPLKASYKCGYLEGGFFCFFDTDNPHLNTWSDHFKCYSQMTCFPQHYKPNYSLEWIAFSVSVELLHLLYLHPWLPEVRECYVSICLLEIKTSHELSIRLQPSHCPMPSVSGSMYHFVWMRAVRKGIPPNPWPFLSSYGVNIFAGSISTTDNVEFGWNRKARVIVSSPWLTKMPLNNS